MASRVAQRRTRGAFARVLRALGLAALSLVAVLGVAAAFFPFERLAPALAARIARETGARAQIESLSAGVGLRGPVLAVRGLTLRWPDGATLALDALRVRPARPSAWLRGTPTAHVALGAAFGSFEGEVSRGSLEGELAHWDLARLPAEWFGAGGPPLAGTFDARIDLQRGQGRWTGRVALRGGEGSLALPGSPIAIPYQRIDGVARLDEAGALQLESVALAGPLVSARAHGSVQSGPYGLGSGEIAIDAEIERLDRALLPALSETGVVLDARGAGRISLSGTAERLELH